MLLKLLELMLWTIKINLLIIFVPLWYTSAYTIHHIKLICLLFFTTIIKWLCFGTICVGLVFVLCGPFLSYFYSLAYMQINLGPQGWLCGWNQDVSSGISVKYKFLLWYFFNNSPLNTASSSVHDITDKLFNFNAAELVYCMMLKRSGVHFHITSGLITGFRKRDQFWSTHKIKEERRFLISCILLWFLTSFLFI
jgi:hypothetical protein